jgi:hypothetical protein
LIYIKTKEKKLKEETFNIIIKCDSEEDREEVLNTINEGLVPLGIQTLYQRKIVRYGKVSNVYFSENDEQFHHDKPRELN